MANQGAKKRKEENARHMKTLLRLIIASNVTAEISSYWFQFLAFIFGYFCRLMELGC